MIYKTNWLAGLLGPLLIPTSVLAVHSEIATSGTATLFIDNGAVFGMGNNNYGTIQPGLGAEFRTPVFSGKLKARSVALSGYRSAVLYQDGTAEFAGPDISGTAIAVKVPATGITDLAVSQRHIYFVANRVLYSWNLSAATVPVQIATGVAQVASGSFHIVILFTDGRVGTLGESWTALSNNAGQLGNGTVDRGNDAVYIVPNLTGTAVEAGVAHSYVLQHDGTVVAFGMNTHYEFGLGTASNQLVPVKVPNLSAVKKISAGGSHVLTVLKQDGSVTACGWHNYVQANLYLTNRTCVPLPITGAVDISTGTGDRIMVDFGTAGQLQGWGGNHHGSLGNGNNIETHQIGISYFQPVTPPPVPIVAAPAPAPAPAPTLATPPVQAKCNNGFGNGDQCAPGKSLAHNKAENAQTPKAGSVISAAVTKAAPAKTSSVKVIGRKK